MSVHVCKQCGLRFEYCRACVFKPIYYKDAGFCSEECYHASKNKIEEVVPSEDVEVVVIKEDTSTPEEDAIEYPYFFTATEEEIIEEKEENKEDDYEQDYGEDIQPERRSISDESDSVPALF
jgi:hypothetical protein